jgi:hypothetical protein
VGVEVQYQAWYQVGIVVRYLYKRIQVLYIGTRYIVPIRLDGVLYRGYLKNPPTKKNTKRNQKKQHTKVQNGNTYP